jgi:Arc/MetJ-type ribon-helix-helix transcriptional regulator
MGGKENFTVTVDDELKDFVDSFAKHGFKDRAALGREALKLLKERCERDEQIKRRLDRQAHLPQQREFPPLHISTWIDQLHKALSDAERTRWKAFRPPPDAGGFGRLDLDERELTEPTVEKLLEALYDHYAAVQLAWQQFSHLTNISPPPVSRTIDIQLRAQKPEPPAPSRPRKPPK